LLSLCGVGAAGALLCALRMGSVSDPYRRIHRAVIPKSQPPPSATPLPKGYTTYGPFDDGGIPLRAWGGRLGTVYHPLVVAEFGCSYYSLWQSTEQKRYRAACVKMADWLLAHQDARGRWLYDWPFCYEGMKISPPWHSAVTQAQASQALSKAFLLSHNTAYLNSARRGLIALTVPLANGGLRVPTPRGCFYEEYPMSPPTHVLNGHMHAVLACFDFLRIHEDADIRRVAQEGVRGLEDTLESYDSGWWSRYDLLPPNNQWLIAISEARPKARLRYAGRSYPLEWKKLPRRFLGFERLSGDRPLPPGRVYAALLRLRPRDDAEVRLDEGDLSMVRARECRGLYITWTENERRLIPLWEGKANSELMHLTIPGKLMGHKTGKPYHLMMIGQLDTLAKVTGRPLFRQTAARWREYTKKYGGKIASP